jgi:hypothetical protein
MTWHEEALMDRTDGSPHPDAAVLTQYALGRLRHQAMRRVEGHLHDCQLCLRVALDAPADHLVELLRRASPAPSVYSLTPILHDREEGRA